MKGHVSVINTLLAKGENVDAATNVRKIYKKTMLLRRDERGNDHSVYLTFSKFRTTIQPCIWQSRLANLELWRHSSVTGHKFTSEVNYTK